MEIRIAAAAILREDGAILLVRKRGTTGFMQPGGKIDGDETALEALQRELFEELGLRIAPQDVTPLGRFTAPAAHEPGCTVRAEMFRLRLEAEVTPQAEIAETLWLQPGAQDGVALAPLTRDKVLPAIWG